MYKVFIILSFLSCNLFCKSQDKVENIKAFAKLYGYIRWFYPGDDIQNIDWNKLAIYGVKCVESTKTQKELIDTLLFIFKPIAPGITLVNNCDNFNLFENITPKDTTKYDMIYWSHFGVKLDSRANSDLYKSERIKVKKERHSFGSPKFGEFINKEIGFGIISYIPTVLYVAKCKTYPNVNKKKLKILQKKINNIDLNDSENVYVHIGSVIIAWNVFQHFFPYFDEINVNWEEILTQTIVNTYKCTSHSEFYIILCKMVAKLEDGHCNVHSEKTYDLPIRTEYIENKIVISATTDTINFQVGDVIIKIDNIPTEILLSQYEGIISGSPQLKLYRALNIFGFDFYSSIANIEILRNGKQKSLKIKRLNLNKTIFENPIVQFNYEDFVEIKKDFFYINIRKLTKEKLIKIINKLEFAKGIIVDSRWGDIGCELEFITHLTKKSLLSQYWSIPEFLYPDRYKIKYYSSQWTLQPKKPYFNGKVIFLTSPSIISSGETYMSFVVNYKLATTIGEPTAGCNGNVNSVTLPCGYRVSWTGMKVLNQDSTQHYLKGFIPNIQVMKTIEGIKRKKDEILDIAIEYLLKNQ